VVATTTTTSKARCHITRQRHTADPVASIVATVLGDLTSILGSPIPQPTQSSGAIAFKRAVIDGHHPEPEARAAFVRARHEHLALNKRAPDEPTLTVTDTDAPPVVSTIVSTALTQTIWTIATTTQTRTKSLTLTITSDSTPSQAASRYSKIGGTTY
jgi:hypothetical protein